MPPDVLLRVRDLTVAFPSPEGGWRPAVEGVSLTVRRGERVGLVGESGSGKSLTALACLGLVPEPGRILGGEVSVGGISAAGHSEGPRSPLRGATVGLVLQEAEGALNPVYTAGFQLSEALRVHRGVGRGEARERALDLLAAVAVGEPDVVMRAYPHELSGGQAQRVMLALALAGEPELLIADEPTSALDLVTQAQVLELLQDLTAGRGLALLFISHDLAVMAGMVERVAVMHAGRILEEGPTDVLFSAPLHPFTRRLLASVPGRAREPQSNSAPHAPQSTNAGCRFATGCAIVRDSCWEKEPELVAVGTGRRVRCPVVLSEEAWEPHAKP